MITTWSHGAADAFMPEAILTELSAVIRRHPWWQARTRLVMAILKRYGISAPARVLDAGCGWGVTLEALEELGYHASGLDVSRQALERLDRPGRSLIEADLTRPLDDVVVDQSAFDAVLALDVIEHLDDDRAAVATLGRLVRPGGFVVVSVPALPDLFSDFDTVQGHRRRYLPPDLRAAFADTGLTIEQVIWWGSWLVPLFRAGRKSAAPQTDQTPAEIYRQHLRLPPWPAADLFRAAFRWEHARALDGKTRRGTSLIAVGRMAQTDVRPTVRHQPLQAVRKYSITP